MHHLYGSVKKKIGEKIEPGRPVTPPLFVYIACFVCVCAFPPKLKHLFNAADQVWKEVWPVPVVPLAQRGGGLNKVKRVFFTFKKRKTKILTERLHKEREF